MIAMINISKATPPTTPPTIGSVFEVGSEKNKHVIKLHELCQVNLRGL